MLRTGAESPCWIEPGPAAEPREPHRGAGRPLCTGGSLFQLISFSYKSNLYPLANNFVLTSAAPSIVSSYGSSRKGWESGAGTLIKRNALRAGRYSSSSFSSRARGGVPCLVPRPGGVLGPWGCSAHGSEGRCLFVLQPPALRQCLPAQRAFRSHWARRVQTDAHTHVGWSAPSVSLEMTPS